MVKQRYKKRGFTLKKWHADNKFNKSDIIKIIMPATLETYAKNEHVGPIERSVREIKERCDATLQALPYDRIPKIMTQELICGIINIMNSFPSQTGISKTISPGTIVDGRSKMTINKKMISYGSYAYVYIDSNNNMNSRSVPAIALRPSNNNGGYYFLNLETNRRIHSYVWNQLPIPPNVIDRLKKIAISEN